MHLSSLWRAGTREEAVSLIDLTTQTQFLLEGGSTYLGASGADHNQHSLQDDTDRTSQGPSRPFSSTRELAVGNGGWDVNPRTLASES